MNLKVRLSIGQLNAYNTMYFDRNIDLSEKISMAKKTEGNHSSYALNEEIYFKGKLYGKSLLISVRLWNFEDGGS